jgi:Rieske Fe-S protein
MSETTVDTGKRTWLIASGCAGAVGGAAVAVPFISTFSPSERAKAAGPMLFTVHKDLFTAVITVQPPPERPATQRRNMHALIQASCWFPSQVEEPM